MADEPGTITPMPASPRLLPWIATMAEALTLPLLFVRADGVLLGGNGAGHRELRHAQSLARRGERIVAADAVRQADWEAALQRAAAGRRRAEWPLAAGRAIVVAPVLGEQGVPMLMLVLPAEATLDEACRLFAHQHGLSASELEVLYALCQGHTPRDIAELRGVSLSTVRTQLARVKRKCGEDLLGTLIPRVQGLPPVNPPR